MCATPEWTQECIETMMSHRIGCSNLVSVFAQGLQKVFLQKVAQLRLFLIAVQNKSQNTTCKQLDLGNVT